MPVATRLVLGMILVGMELRMGVGMGGGIVVGIVSCRGVGKTDSRKGSTKEVVVDTE